MVEVQTWVGAFRGGKVSGGFFKQLFLARAIELRPFGPECRNRRFVLVAMQGGMGARGGGRSALGGASWAMWRERAASIAVMIVP